MTMTDRLCLALDVPDLQTAESWVRRTQGAFSVYKIGLQLFLAEGPRVVERVIAAGAPSVFLDLKLHDIPRTVARAVSSLEGLGTPPTVFGSRSCYQFIHFALERYRLVHTSNTKHFT